MRPSVLEKARPATHNPGMSNGTRTTIYFTCRECGMNYTAMREQHADQHSGRFDCNDCGEPVHDWTGFYSFSYWKAATMRFGAKV